MNREEFTSLPASIALGLLWDASAAVRGAMEAVEAPKPTRSPKFDSMIWRKDGFMWASECDVESLRFWHKRFADSAAGGGQYAEKDEKRAKEISFWISWRQQNPSAIWSGERDHEQVTAKAPAGKPTIYPREPRGTSAPSTGGGSYSYDDDSVAGGDDEIPFARMATGPREEWWR